MPKTIFHAHNWTFERLRLALPELHDVGYDAIQVSPAQKSPAGEAWFLRYQPVDHLTIEGLGSADDLRRLCDKALALGIRVIADVVFNHMAIVATRDEWRQAISNAELGNSVGLTELRNRLRKFPNLRDEDFQPWQDMQGDHWDNENRYDWWGNGEWAELRPTENVISIHCQHLKALFDCGVRGFRFDAVKHMRYEHIRRYVDYIEALPEHCWIYGEVFSHAEPMHREYEDLFPTTDFPFIARLKGMVTSQHSFVVDPEVVFLSETSVRFGMNHDLAYNPPELVEGLLFSKAEQTQLVICLSVLLESGSALVLARDHEQLHILRECVAWRRDCGGLQGLVRVEALAGGWVLSNEASRVDLDFERQTFRATSS